MPARRSCSSHAVPSELPIDRDARGQPAEQTGFGFGLLDSGGKRERAAQIGRELVELVVGDIDSTLIVFGFLQLVDRLAKVDDGV